MENIPFSNVLWESTLKSWGGTITFLGFLASVLSYFVVPNEVNIPLKFVVIIVILLVLLLAITLRAAWGAHQESNIQPNLTIPKVIYVKEPPKLYSGAVALFLIDPTPLLSNDAIVSLYYLEDNYEKFVAIGKVINVQDDKKVQIIITDNYNFEDELEKIMKNSVEELNKLVVKTSIPSFILQGA